MLISSRHKISQGQTTIEYLLLLTVVAVVVIASLGPHSLISNVQNAAGNYYSNITAVIEGVGSTNQYNPPTPTPGGWCAVACTQALNGQLLYAKCACPAPAFGGAYCSGVTTPATTTPCSIGQVCQGAVISCGSGATLPSSQIPSACIPTIPCGTCGFDSCGNVCGNNGGLCPNGPCTRNGQIVPGGTPGDCT